ncbi:hypothetical protein HDV05_003717 [Chytridiales sp. JEL 0842]|nr:hypothetical protein HDV05_003717 [Chytridiales sp. JEL 0842]
MANRVVVLGGGVSGLSAAWYLAKSLPAASEITVLESSSRFGGWVHTSHDQGHLFELGPRTLRPVGEQGTVTLDMVYRLGLQDKVLAVPKSSPAAKNRFIYYNDQLNKMPSSLKGLLLQAPPVMKGVLPAILREPFVKPTKANDESIHQFISRRFSKAVAENIVSAIIHGIYAGNIKELSVRSTLGFLWDHERRHGSVTRGLLASANTSAGTQEGLYVPEALPFISKIKQSSVYSFKGGMQTLTDALVKSLQTEHRNVKLLTNTAASKVEINDTPVVHINNGPTLSADHIISSLPAFGAAPILPSKIGRILETIKFVDVAVVNLSFSGNVLPVQGFGYLIPSSQKADMIGVVFDSCTLPEHDTPGQPETRVTAMMGGHMFQEKFGDPDSVSHDKLKQIAVESIRKHLGITDTPIAWKVSVQRKCIPQYTVGHRERLLDVKDILETEYSGKLSLVGSSYVGVGVNDCVGNAMDVALALAAGRPLTGLERAV